MLTRQHAVDGVQRHAREQHNRHQQEDRAMAGKGRDQNAGGDRQGGGQQRDLVGGDAGHGQPVGDRPQLGLEGRFQRIERRHVRNPRPQHSANDDDQLAPKTQGLRAVVHGYDW